MDNNLLPKLVQEIYRDILMHIYRALNEKKLSLDALLVLCGKLICLEVN